MNKNKSNRVLQSSGSIPQQLSSQGKSYSNHNGAISHGQTHTNSQVKSHANNQGDKIVSQDQKTRHSYQFGKRMEIGHSLGGGEIDKVHFTTHHAMNQRQNNLLPQPTISGQQNNFHNMNNPGEALQSHSLNAVKSAANIVTRSSQEQASFKQSQRRLINQAPQNSSQPNQPSNSGVNSNQQLSTSHHKGGIRNTVQAKHQRLTHQYINVSASQNSFGNQLKNSNIVRNSSNGQAGSSGVGGISLKSQQRKGSLQNASTGGINHHLTSTTIAGGPTNRSDSHKNPLMEGQNTSRGGKGAMVGTATEQFNNQQVGTSQRSTHNHHQKHLQQQQSRFQGGQKQQSTSMHLNSVRVGGKSSVNGGAKNGGSLTTAATGPNSQSASKMTGLNSLSAKRSLVVGNLNQNNHTNNNQELLVPHPTGTTLDSRKGSHNFSSNVLNSISTDKLTSKLIAASQDPVDLRKGSGGNQIDLLGSLDLSNNLRESRVLQDEKEKQQIIHLNKKVIKPLNGKPNSSQPSLILPSSQNPLLLNSSDFEAKDDRRFVIANSNFSSTSGALSQAKIRIPKHTFNALNQRAQNNDAAQQSKRSFGNQRQKSGNPNALSMDRKGKKTTQSHSRFLANPNTLPLGPMQISLSGGPPSSSQIGLSQKLNKNSQKKDQSFDPQSPLLNVIQKPRKSQFRNEKGLGAEGGQYVDQHDLSKIPAGVGVVALAQSASENKFVQSERISLDRKMGSQKGQQTLGSSQQKQAHTIESNRERERTTADKRGSTFTTNQSSGNHNNHGGGGLRSQSRSYGQILPVQTNFVVNNQSQNSQQTSMRVQGGSNSQKRAHVLKHQKSSVQAKTMGLMQQRVSLKTAESGSQNRTYYPSNNHSNQGNGGVVAFASSHRNQASLNGQTNHVISQHQHHQTGVGLPPMSTAAQQSNISNNTTTGTTNNQVSVSKQFKRTRTGNKLAHKSSTASSGAGINNGSGQVHLNRDHSNRQGMKMNQSNSSSNVGVGTVGLSGINTTQSHRIIATSSAEDQDTITAARENHLLHHNQISGLHLRDVQDLTTTRTATQDNRRDQDYNLEKQNSSTNQANNNLSNPYNDADLERQQKRGLAGKKQRQSNSDQNKSRKQQSSMNKLAAFDSNSPSTNNSQQNSGAGAHFNININKMANGVDSQQEETGGKMEEEQGPSPVNQLQSKLNHILNGQEQQSTPKQPKNNNFIGGDISQKQQNLDGEVIVDQSVADLQQQTGVTGRQALNRSRNDTIPEEPTISNEDFNSAQNSFSAVVKKQSIKKQNNTKNSVHQQNQQTPSTSQQHVSKATQQLRQQLKSQQQQFMPPFQGPQQQMHQNQHPHHHPSSQVFQVKRPNQNSYIKSSGNQQKNHNLHHRQQPQTNKEQIAVLQGVVKMKTEDLTGAQQNQTNFSSQQHQHLPNHQQPTSGKGSKRRREIKLLTDQTTYLSKQNQQNATNDASGAIQSNNGGSSSHQHSMSIDQIRLRKVNKEQIQSIGVGGGNCSNSNQGQGAEKAESLTVDQSSILRLQNQSREHLKQANQTPNQKKAAILNKLTDRLQQNQLNKSSSKQQIGVKKVPDNESKEGMAKNSGDVNNNNQQDEADFDIIDDEMDENAKADSVKHQPHHRINSQKNKSQNDKIPTPDTKNNLPSQSNNPGQNTLNKDSLQKEQSQNKPHQTQQQPSQQTIQKTIPNQKGSSPSKLAQAQATQQQSVQKKEGRPVPVRKVDDQVAQFAYLTRAGKTGDGVTKTNQDNFFVVKNFAKIENLWYFGVCDGHGQNGHLVSEYVKNKLALDIMEVDIAMREHVALQLAKRLVQQKDEQEKADMLNGIKQTSTSTSKVAEKEGVEQSNNSVVPRKKRSTDEKTLEMIKYKNQMMKTVQSNLLGGEPNLTRVFTEGFTNNDNGLRHQGFGYEFSGTTIVTVMCQGNRLVTANAGDSRATLGCLRPRNTPIDPSYESKALTIEDGDCSWVARQITRDHKPDDPDEMARIQRMNGRIETYKGRYGENVGPARVWLKTENYPGLAMSRSIGDACAHSVGVSALPEIKEFEISEHDKFLVVASDGVFEFLSNDEIVDLVVPFWHKNDLKGACSTIVRESVASWEREEDSIDDITCIVVFFKRSKLNNRGERDVEDVNGENQTEDKQENGPQGSMAKSGAESAAGRGGVVGESESNAANSSSNQKRNYLHKARQLRKSHDSTTQNSQ